MGEGGEEKKRKGESERGGEEKGGKGKNERTGFFFLKFRYLITMLS